MTREEAKELLLHILMTYEPKDQYGDYDDPEPYEQALTMAIEALSAEPTELLKDGTLKVNVQNGAEVSRVLVWGDDMFGGLYYADTDRPSGEWIPCSERLPNAEDCPMDCMVTRQSKYVGNYTDMAVAEADGTWTHEDWKAITIKGKARCISTRDADIIAWMPLPEPYREDGEG